jgi:hypothetical protein
MSIVAELASFEPWRTGQGQPRNALDPTWSGYDPPLCQGAIEWEGVSKWWWCTKCGHCGWFSVTNHYPVQSPVSYLLHSMVFFFRKRRQQRVPTLPTIAQALFTAGAALHYAAVTPPNQLGQYVQEHIEIR